jgi:hypothetical protein
VSAAIIVKSTPMLEATAIPYRKLTRRANIPRSATQTIAPANSTARPDVSIASSTEDPTSRPAWIPWRCRETTTSA